MLSAQDKETELSTKTLYERLPSDDEEDIEFEQLEEDSSDEEVERVSAEEADALRLETKEIIKDKSYRDGIVDLDLPSDDDDTDYHRSSDSDESEEDEMEMEDIDRDEVKDNILYSNLSAEKAPILLKNAKVLRDGREVTNESEMVNLSERINFLLSEQ